MPIKIEVYRGSGGRHGGEIRDPLLGESLEAALARGQAELDQTAHGWVRLSVTTDWDLDLRLGMLIRLTAPHQPRPITGRIIGIAHRCVDEVMLTYLDLAVPTLNP